MVPTPSCDEGLVYDVKLSSVVPASITGENKTHELTNMDLIMKLHYIKAVYFFDSDAARGLSIYDFKKPMFHVLEMYYPLSGRIRVSENGRPYIKCNDTGVRVVEAKCSLSIEQWLELNDSDSDSQLAYNQILGPDLGFNPLVFIQFTWFKCGGLSIGLSWAHVLGDAFSASEFLNMWAQVMGGGKVQAHQVDIPHSSIMSHIPNKKVNESLKVPSSLQRVQLETDGAQWLISNRVKMQNYTFHITAKQLNHLTQESKLVKKPFEVISAMFWKCLAKVRGKLSESEPKNITICTRSKVVDKKISEIDNSKLTIWTIETTNFEGEIAEVELIQLANLIDQEKMNEIWRIQEMTIHERDDDDDDGKLPEYFILYGANLTFVNWEGLNIYGLELNGQKPVFANCNLSGVGDEGAILVVPAGPEGGEDDKDKEETGRIVNVILPEKHLEELKKELQNEWRIF